MPFAHTSCPQKKRTLHSAGRTRGGSPGEDNGASLQEGFKRKPAPKLYSKAGHLWCNDTACNILGIPVQRHMSPTRRAHDRFLLLAPAGTVAEVRCSPLIRRFMSTRCRVNLSSIDVRRSFTSFTVAVFVP